MKKIVSFIMAFVLCIGLMPLGILADNAEVTVGSASGYGTDTVRLPITLSGNPGVWAFSAEVNYNDTVMTLTSVENGTVFVDSDFTEGNYSSVPYELLYMYNAGMDNVTANGVLCTLVFEIKEGAKIGDYSVEIGIGDDPYRIINVDGESVPFAFNAGTVTVLGEDYTSAPVKLMLDNAELTADQSIDYDGTTRTITAQTSLPADVVKPVVTVYKVEEGKEPVAAESWDVESVGKASYYAEVVSDNYNKFTTEPVTVEITAADFAADAAQILVDGKPITANYAVEYDGAVHAVAVKLPDGATGTITYSTAVVAETTVGAEEFGAAVENVGDKVTVTMTVEQEGYNAVTVGPYTVTVTPKAVTVNDVTAAKVYNGTDTVKVDDPVYTGVLEGDNAVLSGFKTEVTGCKDASANAYVIVVGDYSLTGADAGNYVLANETYNVNVTVTPAILNVDADDVKMMKEATTEPALTFTYQVVDAEGNALLDANTLYADDSFSGALVREEGYELETPYEIKQGTLSAGDNYTIQYTPGKFTIINKEYTQIQITEPESDLTYKVDNSFDLDDIVVVGTYIDEEDIEQTEVISSELLTFTPAVFTEVGESIKVTVSLNTDAEIYDTINVTVEDKILTSIEAAAPEAICTYTEGAEISYEGVTVTGSYDNGKTYAIEEFDIAVESEALDADKELVPGTWNVTVTVGDFTDTYEITVLQKEVVSIKVSGEWKTEYVEGQKFDASAIVVTAAYNNGDTAVVNAEYAPDGELNAGSYAVVFTYTETVNGKDITVTNDSIVLNVAKKAVASIEVTNVPAKMTYTEGTAFEPAGMVIKVTYNDGDTREIADDYTGVTFNPAVVQLPAEGQETVSVIVSYGGKSDTVDGIKVNAKVLEKIVIEDCDKEYVDGDAFVVRTVRAYYNNGSTEAVAGYAVSPAVLTLENETAAETIQVTVTWKEKTAAVDVSVVPCEAINTTTGERYATLEEAIVEAVDGDVIEVQLDTVIDADVEVPADITIKTNGNNVTTAEGVTIDTGKNTITLDTTGNTADIVININGEEVTVTAGETALLDDSGDVSDEFIMIEMAKFHMDHFLFNIEVEETENGSITGKNVVRIGETVIFRITPDEGYAVEDVIVDGESVGAVTEYAFAKVEEDHVISAVFAEAE